LVLGTKEMGVWKGDDGNDWCMHMDKEAAVDTMSRLRELAKQKGVHLAMAHVWIDETGDELLKTLIV
jgi:hypothetical protein